ncbi:right-handed parallel beta-helix repeat-containing protein [Tahibacter amnicola]|uniref:Right-handed parallel beta-helix repeat-containing protein n=1 Tax=Tahibacter amnicola TaxID=2976241 RepID=A0ABY6BP41_9GAMM|nr:right-handed parallel beta-helix repeat-containing protein [Tahibacter amnicola]UXI70165.1 right-handed parallel beta-helix repeat-containing protein [Tahibacter amnicola]
MQRQWRRLASMGWVVGLLFTGWVSAYEVQGLGTASLVGADATDRNGDGDESCVIAGNSPLECGFDATFAANNEAAFSNGSNGGERAFNVFDNAVGAFDHKWCCDSPSQGIDDPATAENESGSLYVQAIFAAPIVLRAFTITTGNDIQPGRDPDIWKIQGSVDGQVYTDIYSYSQDGVSPFSAPNQVLLFRAGSDYVTPPAYRYIRYRVFSTTGDGNTDGTEHHLGELEFFDEPLNPQTIHIDGSCTLHDAILAANTGTAVGNCPSGSRVKDTLVLDAEVTVQAADTAAVAAAHDGHTQLLQGARAGLPDITRSLVIRAGQHTRLRRDPALGCDDADPDAFRLLTSTAALTLQGLTIENGCVAPAGTGDVGGGALLVSDASLTLEGVTFRNNQARSASSAASGGSATSSAQGGAVWISGEGDSTISGSRFEGNSVLGGTASDSGGRADGAGLFAESGPGSVIVDTLFIGNRATGGNVELSRGVAGGPTGGFATGGAFRWQGTRLQLQRVIARDNVTQGGLGFSNGGDAAGTIHVEYTPTQVTDLLLENNQVIGGNATGRAGNAVGGGFVGLVSVGERITAAGNLAQGGSAQGSGNATGGGLVILAGDDRRGIAPLGQPGPVLRNITLSGNRAVARSGIASGSARGGGLYIENGFQALLQHVTAIDNQVTTMPGMSTGTLHGAGISTDGDVGLGHSILRGNTATVGSNAPAASDCAGLGANGVVLSLGYNRIEGAAAGCAVNQPTDQLGVSIPLATLADNGCETRLPDGQCLPTLALLPTSTAAIDAGACQASGVIQDARGMHRPIDVDGVGDGADDCDIGAFEYAADDVLFRNGFQ